MKFLLRPSRVLLNSFLGVGLFKHPIWGLLKHPIFNSAPRIRQELPHRRFARALLFSQTNPCSAAVEKAVCIVLENGPARSLVAKVPLRSSLAVHEYHTASEERCGRGYDRCVQTLLPV